MKKKVDNRVRVMIENGVKMRHRSFFVIVGDKGKDQIVNLHYILTKASVKPQPNVLWCYKKELGFSSHAKKRMKQIKRDVSRGLKDSETDDPFELFISSTKIRYTYYKETHTILGNTFGMCVLQDFEAITPNILARTMETVEGGGIIVILLKTMASLKQLYAMSMDVHDRFRTESHADVVPRFNERFILSLASCKSCLVVDDELNILPISSSVKNITPVELLNDDDTKADVYVSPSEMELAQVQREMKATLPIGALLSVCKSLDQAKAVLTFIDAISEKNLKTTCAMTAGRGRGKSAALGLSLAGAVAYGYANIFVTAPTPENLRTLFEMVLKGFDALEYKEHVDYEIIQATAPELNNAVVRINIFRAHRQTIQYISPSDYSYLSQAELVVIDEAAAIPLPIVKKLMGPYLVFLSSTVNGYEGTGRSLSLKLIKELRQNSSTASSGGRLLREIDLKEPIRYGPDDAVERWLTDLLCLDCVGDTHRILKGTPHPSQCELYYLNRDTLFSYHRASESFLQRLMSLFVSSHYKNTPNDLQMLSDAPAHHIFVLLGPVKDVDVAPDILCAIQVSLEGEISKEAVMKSLSRGEKASGDLIPWTISQQFQDNEFPQLSGARIVRIATHPDVNRMGYATHALHLLAAYYEGKLTNLEEPGVHAVEEEDRSNDLTDMSLLEEKLKPRKQLKPLMEKLTDRPPETLNWMGTSYGLTQPLFNFWKKGGYSPVYVRQSSNDLTGEHTCIMLKSFNQSQSDSWLDSFSDDFRRRFLSLLSYSFSSFDSILALSVLNPYPALIATNAQAYDKESSENVHRISFTELRYLLTEWDLKRLESYAKNLVDYHMILDLVPTVAKLFFLGRFTLSLSYTQCSLLMAIGLQHKSVTDVEKEMNLASNQVLALFNRSIRKIATFMRALEEQDVELELDNASKKALAKATPQKSLAAPLKTTLSKELNDFAAKDKAKSNEKASQEAKSSAQELISELNLHDFAIKGSQEEWDKALSHKSTPNTISIRNAEKSSNPDYMNKKKREADLNLLKNQLADKQSKKPKLNFKEPPHSSSKKSHKATN